MKSLYYLMSNLDCIQSTRAYAAALKMYLNKIRKMKKPGHKYAHLI